MRGAHATARPRGRACRCEHGVGVGVCGRSGPELGAEREARRGAAGGSGGKLCVRILNCLKDFVSRQM